MYCDVGGKVTSRAERNLHAFERGKLSFLSNMDSVTLPGKTLPVIEFSYVLKLFGNFV